MVKYGNYFLMVIFGNGRAGCGFFPEIGNVEFCQIMENKFFGNIWNFYMVKYGNYFLMVIFGNGRAGCGKFYHLI